VPTGGRGMRERPIIFSGPMVRAILDGRKTQTRRAVKSSGIWSVEDRDGSRWPGYENNYGEWQWMACPYGQPGDRLWVRECWGLRDTQPKDGPERAVIGYRADGETAAPNGRYQLWRPSIHMPRWASRITLEITGVRVERVQDISEEDARAEGVSETCVLPGDRGSFIPSFGMLWEQINAKRGYGWDVNPWVWVIEFRRTQ